MEVRQVYLDNAATTKLDEEVAREIMKVMENNFGNPSSIHAFGRSSKALIETARRDVAKHINAMKRKYDMAVHVGEVQSLMRGDWTGLDLTKYGDLMLEVG